MAVANSLVLGLGNRLSGADAFGPAVIEWLRDADECQPGVELVDAHTDLLAYMDRFVEYEQVVLVDVALTCGHHGREGFTGLPASAGGRVAVIAEELFSTWDARSRGAHELSPLMVVKLFRLLHNAGGSPPGPPTISLVAHLVAEGGFRRRPTQGEIEAGAAAVRRVVHAPEPIGARRYPHQT